MNCKDIKEFFAALANSGQQEVWYSCMVSSLSLFEGITLLWAARVLALAGIDLRYHETTNCKQSDLSRIGNDRKLGIK